MTNFIAISLILLIVFLSSFSMADVADNQKAEVEHLLEFVKSSDCIFERNGKKHDAEEGYKHIKRKYWYFKNKVTNTEEFIEFSGTMSTRSGKDYLIYCEGNEPVKSSVWLMEELIQYREKSN